MLITVLMCNFLKYLLFIIFWRKFHPKICCSPYLLKFSIEIQQTQISHNKLEKASQGCENVLVNKLVFYDFYHLIFHINSFLKFCVLCMYLYVCISLWSHVQTSCTVHHKLFHTVLRKFNVFD